MPKIAVNVGWGTVTVDAIYFNFRLRTDSFGWEETIEYSSLTMLDEAVRESYEVLAKVEFPVIDDGFQALIVQNQTPGRSSSLEFFHLLEKQRKYMEIWIICIFDNISELNGESREWTKQLFFRSVEKLIMFEQIYEITSVAPNKQSIKNQSILDSKLQTKVRTSVDKYDDISKPVQRKSVYTKVTHKLFKKRSKSTTMEELNESNLHDNTTTYHQNVHEDTGSINSSSKPPQLRPPTHPQNGDTTPSPVKITPRSARSDSTDSNGAKSNRRFSLMKGLNFKNNVNSSAKLDALDEEEEEQLVCTVYIDVQRGGSEEIKSGVLSYDISLRVANHATGKSVLYRTMQRYNNFKTMYDALMDISGRNSSDGTTLLAGEDVDIERAAKVFSSKGFMSLVEAPFPLKTTWFALTDSELSERTRSLDTWLRDVCLHYKNMPTLAKAAVRAFLNFDMSRQKDIFVQDQLTWGTIDTPNSGAGQASVLIVQRSALDTMPEDFANQLETSNRDGKGSVKPVTPLGSVQNDGNSSMKDMIWETATDSGAGGNKSKANSRITHGLMTPPKKQFSSTRSVF